MRRNGRAPLVGTLWLALAILLQGIAAGALATRTFAFGKADVRLVSDAGGFTAEQMDALRDAIDEEPSGEVTGWAQTLSETVTAKQTSGTAQVDALWIDGDASRLWNLPVVRGQLPYFERGGGCVLDEKTALSLYGSLEIIGESVWVGETELTVQGIVSLPKGLPGVIADPGRGLVLCDFFDAPADVRLSALAFTVYQSGSLTPLERAKSWMSTASMSTRGDMASDLDQRALFTFLLSLPAYLLMALTLLPLLTALSREGMETYRALKALKSDPYAEKASSVRRALRFAGVAALIGGACAAVLLLSPGLPSIPASYLPTRWSDFAFYPDLFRQNMKDAAGKAFTVALRPDILYDALTRFCMWLPVASALALLMARRALRGVGLGAGLLPLAVSGVLAVLAAPLATFVAGLLGFLPEGSAAMLGLPVLWVITSVLCSKNHAVRLEAG